MRLLRAADRAWMPWKNGGGRTMEVAVDPPGASMDGFAWRISIAEVTAAGPFSIFPDTDRTLAILAGEGVLLEIAARPPLLLTTESEPLRFAADQPVMARPLGAGVTDLNLMQRRGGSRHAMRRIAFAAASARVLDLPAAVLLWVRGPGSVTVGDATARPGPLDAMRHDRPTRWSIAADGPALAYAMTFEPGAGDATGAAQ